jgi:hypothetical protein
MLQQHYSTAQQYTSSEQKEATYDSLISMVMHIQATA